MHYFPFHRETAGGEKGNRKHKDSAHFCKMMAASPDRNCGCVADLFGNYLGLFDDFNLDGGLAEKLRPEDG